MKSMNLMHSRKSMKSMMQAPKWIETILLSGIYVSWKLVLFANVANFWSSRIYHNDLWKEILLVFLECTQQGVNWGTEVLPWGILCVVRHASLSLSCIQSRYVFNVAAIIVLIPWIFLITCFWWLSDISFGQESQNAHER